MTIMYATRLLDWVARGDPCCDSIILMGHYFVVYVVLVVVLVVLLLFLLVVVVVIALLLLLLNVPTFSGQRGPLRYLPQELGHRASNLHQLEQVDCPDHLLIEPRSNSM